MSGTSAGSTSLEPDDPVQPTDTEMLAARDALSTPPPPTEDAVKELMRLVDRSFAEAGSYKEWREDIRSAASKMLLSAQEDASLFKLLDIAAHHFTEGRYGWPSSETRAALIAHWRAGKEPVPDVFAAMKQQEKP